MTPARWIAALAVLVTAAVLLLPRRSAADRVTAPPVPPARAVGVVGCSGTACHGGTPATDATNVSPFAASLWFDRDRHVRAFDALTGDAAQRIGKFLAGGQPPKPATEDVRCLACHSDPAAVYAPGAETLDSTPAAQILRRDGVGCEACHGGAGRWLAPHTGWGRNPADRPAHYRDHGMTWLNDLAVRADTCAGCHVGAPADPARGLPRREVTHAMIAAGHPRLAFEFVSYSQRLPPHWVERDRDRPAGQDARGPDFAARAWLAGQTASARAAVGLLADPAGGPDWPEFARFDCYACHHDAGAGGWRRPEAGGRPGQIRGNTWDVSLPLRRLAADRPALRDAFAKLRLDPRTSDRAAVARAAGSAAQQVTPWRQELVGAPAPAELLGTVLRDLTADRDTLAHLSWDDAAQICLALAAWREGATAPPPEFAATYGKLAAALRFRSADGGAWNSPRHYAPASVQELFGQLHGQLDQWLRAPQPPRGH